MKLKNLNLRLLLRSTVLLLLPVPAYSVDALKTWDAGGNGNFANAPNWDGGATIANGTAPTWGPLLDTDSLLFAGAGSGNSINLNVVDATVKKWTFTNGTYTFTGAQNVTLGDTTTKPSNTGWLTNSGTGTITFNNSSSLNFRFGGIDASGGHFVFGSNSTINIGFGLNEIANNVVIKGTQTVTVNGVLTGAGTETSPGGSFVKQGSNTLLLNGSSPLWEGRLDILDGVVRINKAASLGSPNGSTRVDGDLTAGRLELSGNIGVAEPLFLSGRAAGNTADHLRSLSGNNLLSGAITLDSSGSNYAIQADSGTLSISGGINYGTQTGPATLRLIGGGDGLISGVIGFGGANLGIIKEGSGTWTLAGANAFTGPIEVTAGRLNLSTAQTGGGAITLADSSTLGLTLAQAGQTFATSALSLGSTTGAALALDLGSFGSNPVVPVIQTGALTTQGTNVINLKAGGLSVGQVPLISYTSIGGNGFAGLSLGAIPARTTAALVDDAANNRVLLNVTSFDYPRWTGSQDANWDADDGTGTGTANWREFNSGLVTRYLQGPGGLDGVRFDDTATGSTSVNLTNTLTPAFIKVVNDVQVFTFTGEGKLSGPGGFTKEGASKLVLLETGGNDFTGVSSILGGTVEVGDGLTGGAGHLGSGFVLNEGLLVFNRPDNYTFAGSINGSGNIVKRAPGITTLSGTNTFTGTVTVEQGTIRLANGNALGDIAGGTTITNGAALDVNGQLVAGDEIITISGDGISGSGAVVNLGSGGSGAGIRRLILSGPASIGGSGRWDIRNSSGGLQTNGHTLTKTGTNSVFLANVGITDIANLVIIGAASRLVFEGDSTLGSNAGIITVETGAQLGFEDSTATHIKPIRLNAGTIRITGGTYNTLSAVVTLDTVGTIDVANNTELLIDGRITGSGNLVKATAGILKVVSNNSDYSGVTQISAGQLWLGNDTTTGDIPGDEIINNGQLHLRRIDTALVVNQNISGTGTLVMGNANLGLDTQLVTLTGNNTFTGAVTISRGFLRVTNSSALGAGPKTVAIQSGQRPSLVLDGSAGDISLDSTISFNTSSDSVAGAIVNEAGNNTISGPINLRNGQGGNTRINVLTGSLRLEGTISAATDATSTRTLILDGAGTSNLVSGPLTNATTGNLQLLALAKTGSGTWTLNAANSYTGVTEVQAGTLKLGAAASIASSSSITLFSGATFDTSAVVGFTLAGQTLAGSGTVLGDTSLLPGSVLNPGGSADAGSIAFNGRLELAGGTLRTNLLTSTLAAPAQQDIVSVAGDVHLTAPGVVEVIPTGTLLAGSHSVVTYTGSLVGDVNTLSVNNPTRYTTTLDTSTPGQINLVFGGSAGSLVWNGDGASNTWDNATTANFNGGVDTFLPVDAVIFDGTSSNTAVNIAGQVQPSFMLVAGTSSYTFSGTGSISGNGRLTKAGAEVLTINTVNSFTGKTTISGGTLLLGTAGRLNGTRWIDVDLGAIFDVSAITAGFTLGGTTDQRVLSGRGSIVGSLSVTAGGVIKPGSSSNTADINTAGDGAGQLTFSQNLTLTGNAAEGSPRALFLISSAVGTVADPLDSAAVTAYGSTVPLDGDHILVGGSLRLDQGSTIRVELAASYTPEFGDVFNLADWASLELNANGTGGSFDPERDLDLPPLPSGLGWNHSYFTTHGILVVGVAKPALDAIAATPGSSVNPGVEVTLSIPVTSSVAVTYQWRKNGIGLQGQTSPTLVFTAEQLDEGSYTVAVSNVAGTTVSEPLVLSVNDPVDFSAHPISATRNPGQNYTFSVTPTGTGPFEYQWRRNEAPVQGANGQTLELSNLTEADEGDYDVVVTNTVGSATSLKGTLSVNDPVEITTHPQPWVVLINGSVTLNVGGTGTGPFSYQWRKNGTPINLATGPTYTISNAAASDQGTYDVVVTNSVNSDISDPALVEVVDGATPRILAHPQSRLVGQGSGVTLQVLAVASPPVKFQWLKNNKPVAGAVNAALTIGSAQLASAGSYSVRVTSGSNTSVVSNAAGLSIVDTSPATNTLGLNATATIKLAAAGTGLGIEWTKNGSPLPADSRISLSSDKKTLKVVRTVAEDAGEYRASITAPGGSINSGLHTLKVFTDAPVILTPVTFPAAAVGAPFTFPIPVDSDVTKTPTKFTAKPLPPGLKLDAVKGVISGVPTAPTGAQPLTVTLTAANAAGKSVTTASLVVEPLPTGSVGIFSGVVERNPALNNNLGGSFDFTTTTSGSFTGKLRLAGASHSLAGKLVHTLGSTTPVATLVVKRGALPSLTVVLSIDSPNDRLIASTVTDGTTTIPLNAWRNKWKAKTNEPPFKGYYTVGLDIPQSAENDLSIPQGTGYASFTLAGSGALTVSGKLSDGTSVSRATFAGPEGEIAVFQLLYSSKGSVVGALDITPGTLAQFYNDSTAQGVISWFKPVVPGRLYSATGIGPISLEASGGRYVPPLAPALFLDLPAGGGEASLTFSGARVSATDTPPGITVTIGDKNKVTLPLVNPAKTSLKLTPSTGAFSGSFTLVDPVPASTARYNRSGIAFQGLVVRTDSGVKGFGWFLLPQLPSLLPPQIPSLTLTTSPVLSGQVVLEPVISTP